MNDRQSRAGAAAIASFLALAAMPSLVFGVLIAVHDLSVRPGLRAWAACTIAACCAGLLLGRDIGVMTALIRGLAANPAARPARLMVPGMASLGREARHLLRAERLGRTRLANSAAEDRALVERLPDPLIKLDGAGNPVWRNASAAAIFGAETAALLRHPDLRAALAQAQAGGAPVRQGITTAAPVLRDLDATIIPVGGPVYLLLTDRTRERALEKMRADFVANSSHELRTPLASLIGFIETLRGPAADDPEAQQRFLTIMSEQAGRMQRVIADLLSLSRIEISEHQPPQDRLALPPLLARLIAGMEPMLTAADTRIDVTIDETLPEIPADADQLAQLFTNLFDNAIKYGKRGGRIKLHARASTGDDRFAGGGVLVSVIDDGPGIPREHIPRLTERFYRVDKGRSRAVGGTGLGLAIVKHIVNRHRGRLLIESTEAAGTNFTVWLPN
ncbi:MAG: ATP-binding protein [Acidocella sp.]|nr:ATP-binding protein [Acidocella sp.]